jgi:preprotein translocase subunit Sss1
MPFRLTRQEKYLLTCLAGLIVLGLIGFAVL